MLESISLREIRLALKEPFVASHGVQESRRILLLEVRSRDGLTAWSECVAQETPGYAPETVDSAWDAIRDWLAPLLQGSSVDDPSAVYAQLSTHVRGHAMAKAALEMACWDLEAQRRGTSLASLLGGTQRRVPVGVALGIQDDPQTLARKVKRCLADGYRRIKLKIARGADQKLVAAVREAVGPDVPLAVDANGAYTRGDAAVLRGLDRFGLSMIEQPLHEDDLVGHADLQAELTTPICLDESITGPERVETMIRLGSGRIANIKPGRMGGFQPVLSALERCAAGGVGAWVGGMFESGIGRAYNVALASLPYFSLPGDLSPSGRYWEEDVVSPAWTMSSDGFVEVPLDRIGLGIEVDRDRIEGLIQRAESIRL